jgi:hypothetical protein
VDTLDTRTADAGPLSGQGLQPIALHREIHVLPRVPTSDLIFANETERRSGILIFQLLSWSSLMPIRPFLHHIRFDPEATRVMGVAFEMVRAALWFAGRHDLANEIIAERIIELAKAGERNPDLLCERALDEIRASTVPRAMR